MSIVTKIADGNSTSYDIGVRMDNVQPIMEKSWTGLISSANNSSGSGCDFILGEFNTTPSTPWQLEVELDASYIAVTDWSGNTAASHHMCHVEGFADSTTTYSMWNFIRSTSYRPFYNFIIYRPSTSDNKWYFGVTMYNCNRNTHADNKRNIRCRVRNTSGLQNVVLHDSPANTDYATYYRSMAQRAVYDIANVGLRETGDENSTVNVGSYDILAYCDTAAGTVAKIASFAYFDYSGSKVFKMRVVNANTASTPTLNVNGQGAKSIYLLTADNTWSAASSTVNTITAGVHWVYFNGTAFYILPDVGNFTTFSVDTAVMHGQASYSTKNVFCQGIFASKGAQFRMRISTNNTNTGDLSLNVNLGGAKPLYYNGSRANGTTNNISTGWATVVYDGTNYNAYTQSAMVVAPEAKHSVNADNATKATYDDEGLRFSTRYMRRLPNESTYGYKVTKAKADGWYDNVQFSILEGYASQTREQRLAFRWSANAQMDGTNDKSIRRLIVASDGAENVSRQLKVYVSEDTDNYYCWLLWMNGTSNAANSSSIMFPARITTGVEKVTSAQDLTALTAVNYYSDEVVTRKSDLATTLSSRNNINNLHTDSMYPKDYIIHSTSVPAGTFPSDWTARDACLRVFGNSNRQFQHLYYSGVLDYHYERCTTSGSPGSFVFTDWTKVFNSATSTYSSTGTQAVNGYAVASAINALDVSDSAVAGKVVSAVSETNGKISVSRRALVAGDIPNLDASKITTGCLDYWRSEVYLIAYSRPVSSSGPEKQWTKFAWKEVPNYATASVWDSCDGVFDVYRKSYGVAYSSYMGELALMSKWGHGGGSGYSFKTSGDKCAVWNSYISTSVNATESASASSGRIVVKVVCTDTTIEWWFCNQVWDARVFLKPKFKNNFTGIRNTSDSDVVTMTPTEFTEYCADKYVKNCEHGNSYTPFAYRAHHVAHSSNYNDYKELTFTDANATWANFIAGASNTNSFCYKLFGDTAFDDDEYTVRAIGRLNIGNSGNEIAAQIGVGGYPQYEVYATRQVGYVRFYYGGKMKIYAFNRYGVITSTPSSFIGDVTGNCSGTSSNVTGTVAIANGGTGATTAKAAEYVINGTGATEISTDATDDVRFLMATATPSSSNGIIAGFRKGVKIWNYIKGKLTSVSGVNISGNAATASAAQSGSALETAINGKSPTSHTHEAIYDSSNENLKFTTMVFS